MPYQTEHPQFVLNVPVPDHWQDISWRNDAMPSWSPGHLSSGERVRVWVDYADSAMREHADDCRFVVDCDDVHGITLLMESNDWARLLDFVGMLSFDLSRGVAS